MTASGSPVVDDIEVCIARVHPSDVGRFRSIAVGSCRHVAAKPDVRFTEAALGFLMAEAAPEEEPATELAVPWREFPDFHTVFLEQAVETAAPRRTLDVDDLRPRRS
jgi:hypothetical protein